ncbi:unnamed protein product [Enterobius vermicularis]|uniref:Uncharacterized protein n=1 Tax=Enterobius vermicularis TaxID=51028 RepID=A0A0N4VJZ9_ENTVE|nr:unnamed protein product [Enterobius vermicularis]
MIMHLRWALGSTILVSRFTVWSMVTVVIRLHFLEFLKIPLKTLKS